MAWLPYAKRMKFTIDHTLVSADLTDQPHKIWLSADSGVSHADFTAFFAEMTDANKLKISCTTYDGTTEFYVEVVSWDAANKVAELYGDIPAVSTAGDTDIYLYFDSRQLDNSTYVGVTGSTPAKAVWDSNFKAVYHMNDGADNAHIYDSTANENHGTKTGANEPLMVDGLKGKAQSFDGVNGYLIVSTNIISTPDAFTAESLWQRLGNSGGSTSSDYHAITTAMNGHGNNRMIVAKSGTPLVSQSSNTGGNYSAPNYIISTTAWDYIIDAWNGATVYAAYNGIYNLGTNTTGSLNSGSTKLQIGRNPTVNYWYSNGIIDELRISSIARDPAYIKLTNYSERDTAGSWGTEEQNPRNKLWWILQELGIL
jgi:hypothetical protein